jgi:hypothetical protein
MKSQSKASRPNDRKFDQPKAPKKRLMMSTIAKHYLELQRLREIWKRESQSMARQSSGG